MNELYSFDSVKNSLKSPRDHRHAFLGGVMQIWVTRACDKACFGCTQGSNLGGRPGMISVEHFETACASLKDYFGVVGMFGGNPVLHPRFEELCDVLKKYIPFERRGIWCNNPRGKAALLREVFNPEVSNINVHLDLEAAKEFQVDWPESSRFIKGIDSDSLHSSPFVSLRDVIDDESKRWKLISNCDVNRYWSAMICVVRNRLVGYFCEIAGAQAMLMGDNEDYPLLGHEVVPGWWNRGIEDFKEQVSFHCHRCGVPLKHGGDYAINGTFEYASTEYSDIYRPKIGTRKVVFIKSLEDSNYMKLERVTEYIKNSAAA
jgi:organic radical activating enzyme